MTRTVGRAPIGGDAFCEGLYEGDKCGGEKPRDVGPGGVSGADGGAGEAAGGERGNGYRQGGDGSWYE